MDLYQKLATDRATRVVAKDWFIEKTGGMLNLTKYRAHITRIKKQMLTGEEPTLPQKILRQLSRTSEWAKKSLARPDED